MLSFPPTNHFAKGAFDQSSAWSQSVSQLTSSRARRSQKAMRSFDASSYTDASALACAANSSDGGKRRSSCRRLDRASLLTSTPVRFYARCPALTYLITVRPGASSRPGAVIAATTSVDHRLLGARAGERSHLHFGPLVGVGLARQHCAEPAGQESDRNRDDARVRQREPGEVDVGE